MLLLMWWKKIDPHFIPVSDHSEPLELGAEFTLLSMTNFDEISGELSIVASINLTWKGSNLPAWDPSQLGGKETYALSVKDIWTPRLLLLNPAKAVTDLAALSDRARITSDRTVIWQVISGIMVRTCFLKNVMYRLYSNMQNVLEYFCKDFNGKTKINKIHCYHFIAERKEV